MKHLSKVTALAVGAALLGAGLFASVAASAEAPQAPKTQRFGCVDVMKVLNNYKKSSQIHDDASAKLQAAAQAVQKKLDGLRQKNANLDMLVPGTPQYKNAKEQIDFEVYKAKYEYEQKRQEIIQGAVQKMALVYTQVGHLVANYAKQHDLTCVLVTGEQPSNFQNFEQLQGFITAQTVIYRDDALDITGAILKILNK